uniref:(northern house mosquito) hypothetical protein n=1 Tax=Culex pipiens TaxID=7175 RepID=A0A8D8CE38_CULPI
MRVPYGPGEGCGLRRKPERGRGSASPTGALVARNLARFLCHSTHDFCSCWCCLPVGVVGVAAVGGRRDQRSPASCLPSSDSRGVDASGVDLVTWGVAGGPGIESGPRVGWVLRDVAPELVGEEQRVLTSKS